LRYLVSVKFEQLHEIEDRFRAGGIPIYVEEDQVRSNEAAIVPVAIVSRFNLPAPWYRISVCLEEQFEEAKQLLADSNYEVRAPVDVEEFEKRMKELGANRPVALRPSARALNWLVGMILLGIAIAVAVIALMSKS